MVSRSCVECVECTARTSGLAGRTRVRIASKPGDQEGVRDATVEDQVHLASGAGRFRERNSGARTALSRRIKSEERNRCKDGNSNKERELELTAA